MLPMCKCCHHQFQFPILFSGIFYTPVRPNVTQMRLIERVLMCGYKGGARRDITAGMVYGFNRTNECGKVDTGFIKDDFRRNLRLHQ